MSNLQKCSILALLTFGIAFLGGCSSQYRTQQPVRAIPAPTAQQIPTSESALVPVTISIKKFSFIPADLSIKVGTTVIWTNNDTVPHTVTAQGSFESTSLWAGESFGYTFATAWSYSYSCSIHPRMQASITVTD